MRIDDSVTICDSFLAACSEFPISNAGRSIAHHLDAWRFIVVVPEQMSRCKCDGSETIGEADFLFAISNAHSVAKAPPSEWPVIRTLHESRHCVMSYTTCNMASLIDR